MGDGNITTRSANRAGSRSASQSTTRSESGATVGSSTKGNEVGRGAASVEAEDEASLGTAASTDSSAGEQRMGTSVNASSNRPLTVMVIDDSKTVRRSAESLLQKEGWAVVTAVDGFDALAKVVEHEPDVVFADIMMPRLDGYQTCALIKNNARYGATPVIMLSSKDSIFDKARGRVVGSEHYLTKPFSREDLVGAVRRHVHALVAETDCA